jgi:hypothetical protein
MYDRPKLIKAGKAGDVIQGLYGLGDDLDGTIFDGDQIFSAEQEGLAAPMID